MQRRRATILASALFLIFSMFVPATSGAVLAKDPNLDVRGKWQLVWSGFAGESNFRLYANAVILAEDMRTGAILGYYDLPTQQLGAATYRGVHSAVSGRVIGHTAVLRGLDLADLAMHAKLFYKAGILELSASEGDVLLEGMLLVPAPPQSRAGGERPSSIDGQCTPALGEADGAEWCLVEVADDAGHKKVKQPSGKVTVDIKGGLDAITCALIGTTGGKSSSCRVTLPAPVVTATRNANGTPNITVTYPGDKIFGPSEGSLVLPDESAHAGPSAPGTAVADAARQLLDTALEILALQRQELLEIDQQLP